MATPTNYRGIFVDPNEFIEWHKSNRVTTLTCKHQFLVNAHRDLHRIARIRSGPNSSR